MGGVSDLSAVFYNPGALALVHEPRFVFGLTSIELARIEAESAAGQGLDFDSFVFDIVPAMVAGHVGRNHGRADHFAFAFLSRHDTDWDLGYSNARGLGCLPGRRRRVRPRARARGRVLGGRHLVAPRARGARRSGCPPSSPTGRRGAGAR